MNPEQTGRHHRQEDAFASGRETTEALLAELARAQGSGPEAQQPDTNDDTELAAQIRKARMELNGESEDTVILRSAGETARDLTDRKLANEVYASLAGAYGERGDVAGGIESINQINDYVTRLEGLMLLAETSQDEYVKGQLAHAAKNESGQAIDIDRAKEVFYKLRSEDNNFDLANDFAKLVGEAAVNAPNYARAVKKRVNVRQQAELMTRIAPQSPEPSLGAQAKALISQAPSPETALKYLDQYHAQVPEQPGPEKDKMLAAYAVATVELSNKPLRGQAAA